MRFFVFAYSGQCLDFGSGLAFQDDLIQLVIVFFFFFCRFWFFLFCNSMLSDTHVDISVKFDFYFPISAGGSFC